MQTTNLIRSTPETTTLHDHPTTPHTKLNHNIIQRNWSFRCITKSSRIATTNTAAEEEVPLLSLCLVGQMKMFRHESAVRDEKVDHRNFSQCASPSSSIFFRCPTNNILPWKLQYNMLFTVSVLLNVEHTKEKSGTDAPQGSSKACSKNVLSYLFFDFENNHRYEPVERFTTPHPVKQQTLEVSGLSDGCKGRD
ncbi:hypothetical protein D9C73_017342 [Collichthys lucidus]|uniref:Uncharacterized protein n=1 Tax=Collichthys lucidus TaxID=240159 RepID=A0A4V6AR60_COLLU|nr:hypothetical protein D9C73_017342 [Collichthys lucidus]